MNWDYRVCKKTNKVEVVDDEDYKKFADTYGEDSYGICEVYYNDKGEICFASENFEEPFGTTLDELKLSFKMMKEAFDLPVLDLDNIVYSNEY